MGKKFLLIICCLSAGLVGMAAAVLPVGYFLGLIPPSKAMVVLSGSMAPEIKVGSLVIVAKADNYLTNEIISFSPSGSSKDIVTHRIVAKEFPEGIEKSPLFLTAGDANKKFDTRKVRKEQIIGKVVFSVPYFGYLADFIKKPYGFILFVIVPVTIIVYEELKSIKRNLLEFFQKKKKEKEESVVVEERAGVNKLAIIIPLLAVALTLTSLSLSYFSDRELSSGNSFAAGVWITPPPSNLADHIVISEVQIKGANANEDFVELYNPTNESVSLTGWKLRKKTSPGTEYSLVEIGSGKSIPAHGFFLWANFAVSVGADVSTTETLSENNSVALKDSSGQFVDQVAWGRGTNQFVEGTIYPNSPATNQSIERKAYFNSDSISMTSGSDVNKGNAYDSENNINDFVLRNVSQPQNTFSTTETP